jgi:acyl-coenzyme A synthetase/AMP-(fatty) acid ligase
MLNSDVPKPMSEPANHPTCPSPFNMAEYVLRAGLDVPDKPALEVLGGDVWTYADIRYAVRRMAGGFQGLGLAANAKVMIRLGNRVEFPIVYLACIWAGLVPVPTSPQLNVKEITKIATELGPDLVVAENGIACPKGEAPVLTLDDLLALQGADPCPPVMGDSERLAYIIFTSGTSGKPRGVCHAHRAIWARRMMFEGWYGLRATDRVLHAGAFNWSYTMGAGLMDPWTLGATALIPPEGMNARDLAACIKTSQASIFAGAPGVFRQLLKTGVLSTSDTLRHGLSAGEALSPNLRHEWHKQTGCDIHEALGMSECSTFISGSPASPAPSGTSGRAQTGRRIAVLEHGMAVETGTAGQLAIHRRDPGLMLGYLNEAPIAADWFATGDTVSICKDGWVTYLGRNDDIMTAGGFRISPIEVEAVFDAHPMIDSCAATQVSINADTTLIALFYVATAAVSEDTLRAHAQDMLAAYKKPRLYIPLASLPKGANGKLNRKLLRTDFEANL